MSNSTVNQKNPERSRRETEDDLLHKRAGIFLIINGFAIQKFEVLAVAVALAFVNALWILASIQSWILIKNLVKKSPEDSAQPAVDEILGTSRFHHILRPTTLVSVWIPTSVYAAWLYDINNLISSKNLCFILPAVFALPFIVLLLLKKAK